MLNYQRVVLEVLKLSSLGFARGNSARGLKVHRSIVMPCHLGCPFSAGTEKMCHVGRDASITTRRSRWRKPCSTSLPSTSCAPGGWSHGLGKVGYGWIVCKEHLWQPMGRSSSARVTILSCLLYPFSKLCARVFNLSFHVSTGSTSFNFLMKGIFKPLRNKWKKKTALCLKPLMADAGTPMRPWRTIFVACALSTGSRLGCHGWIRMTWKSCFKPLQVISPGYFMIRHNQY